MKKLVVGLGAVVAAVVVVVLSLVIFSERPQAVPSGGLPAAEEDTENKQGSELVKINWRTQHQKGGGKQPGQQLGETIPQPRDEGETD